MDVFIVWVLGNLVEESSCLEDKNSFIFFVISLSVGGFKFFVNFLKF